MEQGGWVSAAMASRRAGEPHGAASVQCRGRGMWVTRGTTLLRGMCPP